MKSPRVALVGVGYWGKNLARVLNQINVLAAICDTNETVTTVMRENYPECRFFSSFSELLADDHIEAVVIATPAETHGRMVQEALLAGKDVFVEKPLSLSVNESEDLVALAADQQKILMVGHLLWYHPAVLKLKDLVDKGELGRIQYIYSNRLNIGKIRREENILWSFAPHDISVILGLINEDPIDVLTSGGNYLHQRISDVTVSCLAFPSGVKAHIFVSWLHPFKEQKLVVVGDRKMAVFNDMEPADKLLVFPHTIEWRNQIPIASKAESQKINIDSTEPLKMECQHFVECIETRAQPRTDGNEGLRVLKVLQRCQDALAAQAALSAMVESNTDRSSGSSSRSPVN